MRYFVFLYIMLPFFQLVNAELPEELSIAELVTGSDFILSGVLVRAGNDVIHSDEQPYKLLSFQIKNTYKGALDGDEIDVLIPTQEEDFLKPVVHSRMIPEYKTNNEYVLFLNKYKSQWYIRCDNIWQEKLHTQSLENKVVQEIKRQNACGGKNIFSIGGLSVLILLAAAIGYIFARKMSTGFGRSR